MRSSCKLTELRRAKEAKEGFLSVFALFARRFQGLMLGTTAFWILIQRSSKINVPDEG